MIADLLVLFFVVLFMFIPTFIARSRHLKRRVACFWVNLFLGWTVIIWVPLLVWSVLTSAIES